MHRLEKGFLSTYCSKTHSGIYRWSPYLSVVRRRCMKILRKETMTEVGQFDDVIGSISPAQEFCTAGGKCLSVVARASPYRPKHDRESLDIFLVSRG